MMMLPSGAVSVIVLLLVASAANCAAASFKPFGRPAPYYAKPAAAPETVKSDIDPAPAVQPEAAPTPQPTSPAQSPNVQSDIDPAPSPDSDTGTCARFEGFEGQATPFPEGTILLGKPVSTRYDEPELRRRQYFHGQARRNAISKSSQEILSTALSAGHVMMIIAGHQFARIVMVGYNGIGNLARARPFGSTTDHILPLNMPYAFVKSLPAGAMRLKIQALLPFDGTETILTKTFKERIFNEACNLMLIPGWMNEALGNILRPHHSRPATKLDGPSAKLLSDYMSKVKKFYLITAATAAKAMAEAAQDPQVQQAFMEYCQSEFNRVFNYVSQTSGWTGPALVPYKIEGGRPKLVTGQGRGLREIDLGAANATELANAAVNATLPVDPYTLNSTTLDALKVENNTVSDPVTPPASQPTIAAAPPTASNSDGSIDIPPPQSSPPPPLSTTNTTAVAPPIAASNSSDGTIQINPSSPLDQKLTKPYSAPIDQNIEEYQDA